MVTTIARLRSFTPMKPTIHETLDNLHNHIYLLQTRAARAPPMPSGSSVTEPDSDLDVVTTRYGLLHYDYLIRRTGPFIFLSTYLI